MLIVFCQNPVEESGGANFWSCFFHFSFSSHVYFCNFVHAPRCAVAARWRCSLFIIQRIFSLSPDLSACCPSCLFSSYFSPPPFDGCDRVVVSLVGIHAYRLTCGYIVLIHVSRVSGLIPRAFRSMNGAEISKNRCGKKSHQGPQ